MKKIIFFLTFISSVLAYGKLPNFTLTLTATHETCLGNGAIEATVSGMTPNAQIVYELFLAPDFSNPIANSTNNVFSSLSSGSYRIVATQSFEGQISTQESNIVVENLLNPIDFEITYNCSNSLELVVILISGDPISYEIIAGPELRSPQQSNIFSNLPIGNYTVKLVDDCGDALVKEISLLNISLTFSEPQYPEILEDCDSILVSQTVSFDFPFQYPIQIIYELFVPNSNNIIYEINLTNSDLEMLSLSQNFPTFDGLPYDYTISIFDYCGRTWVENFVFDPSPKLNLSKEEIICNQFKLNLNLQTFKPPYQLEFVAAPINFDPYLYFPDINEGFSSVNLVFGNEEFPIPNGGYLIRITDSCGRITEASEEVLPEEVEVIINGANNGCLFNTGNIQATVDGNRYFVSATIIEAPASYPFLLPNDISNAINPDGDLVLNNVAVGIYLIQLVDNCGQEYIEEVDILPFEHAEDSVIMYPNCDPFLGSIRIFSGNGALTQVTITNAPQDFEFQLPFDASFYINSFGVFFMQDLPAGQYSFSYIDTCGFENTLSTNVKGYQSGFGIYDLQRNCGSFNINITDLDTTVTDKSYWLQRLNNVTNTWGHPFTGEAYLEGSIPNLSNAIQLEVQIPLLNIFLTGEFRIIKIFRSFNPIDSQNLCIDVLTPFVIGSGINVLGAYTLNCEGGSDINDVVLDVAGVGPFQAMVTFPVLFDNGNSLVFENLASGLYTFQVTDACGNIQNINIEMGVLAPLVRAQQPQSMLVCRPLPFNDATFILSDQTSVILGNQNPNNYFISYHLTQADADSGENPLPLIYTNETNPQTLYARVKHVRLDFCIATTSFPIFVGRQPVIPDSTVYFVCEGETTVISAEQGYDAYEWITGETTAQIVVSEPGSYSVMIKNNYQDFSCDINQEIQVIGSSIATIIEVISTDWTSEQNSIMVYVSGTGNYHYSLDGFQFQNSPYFTSLPTGLFTVYVKDLNGCGIVSEEVLLLYYPNFFTPNGDGDNDTWRIKFSAFERQLNIKIYDRYGKFIYNLDPNSTGWDGTYNGNPLPSTDYWFVVTRANGKIHKGHFALKR